MSGNSVLLEGDCALVLKEIPTCSIDLTVTSPPYDNLRTYKGYSFDFERIAQELFRVTKEGGVVVWIVGDSTTKGSESGTSFKQAIYFKQIGFNLHDTMIYASEKPPLTHNRYEQKFEYMFVFSKGKPKTFNPIMEPCTYFGQSRKTFTLRRLSDELSQVSNTNNTKEFKIKGNIWKYDTGSGKSTTYKEAFKHPAIFPEKLVEDHVFSWSEPGDLILDPFLGSGTTAVVALKMNRKVIGIEISNEYLLLAEKRILKQTS